MKLLSRLGWLMTIGAAFGALAGCTSISPGHGLKVATSGVSQTLCSAVFVSGRDIDQAYREEMRPQGGMWMIDWAMRYELDRSQREVRANVYGAYASRSVYRDGMGCLLDNGHIPPATPPGSTAQGPALLPEIAGSQPVVAADPRLRAVVDAAFDLSWAAPRPWSCCTAGASWPSVMRPTSRWTPSGTPIPSASRPPTRWWACSRTRAGLTPSRSIRCYA